MVALFAFLAVRLHNRHLIWPALVVVLFMHGCTYAAASFDASFGVSSGSAYTVPLLILGLLLLVGGTAFSGKRAGDASETGDAAQAP